MFSNDSILYKYKYINKYKFIFYLFRDLWIGKCAHVLPGSKTNLTKFARFYLLILSHTHIYTHTRRSLSPRCCRIPLLQPQLYNYNIFDFNHHTTTVTTTTTAIATTIAAAAITTSAIIAAPAVYNLLHAIRTSTYEAIFVYTSTLVSTVIISPCFLFCVDGNATPRNNKTLYIM